MTYTFRKAIRSSTNLVIGISGETGQGKTNTALRIAKGLARGGKIIAGDTEKGRILRYADQFDFDYDEIKAPFRPQSYIDFFLTAYEKKPSVIIIDSATHEWVSEGGCLEWHSEICRTMSSKWGGSPEKYNFQAWAEPKQEHWKLISKIEAPPCHIIMTFRAKEKFEQLRVNGKTVIESRGLCPDGAEDLPYTMDFVAMLDQKEPGAASFNYKPLMDMLKHILKPGEVLTEKHGELLAAWAEGKTPELSAIDFKWKGSDGNVRSFKDVESFRKAVMGGISQSTDAEKLSLTFAANSGEFGHLRVHGHGTLADEIEHAINEKRLRLSGVMPPV